MKERKYLGKWELGCMAFHTCIYRIFTTELNRFREIGGSAGWLSALFVGVVFLFLLFLSLSWFQKWKGIGILELCEKRSGKFGASLVGLFLAGYWLWRAGWALQDFAHVLQSVSYEESPLWFLMFFLLLGALVPVICGKNAVYRMYSLAVPVIGVAILAVIALGLRHAKVRYLAPVLGTGLQPILGQGLSMLSFFGDIVFILLLHPQCREEVKVRKTMMLGAGAAVLVLVATLLVSSMTRPYMMEFTGDIPIYPMTKAAQFGKFWERMDGLYLITLLFSGILYVSLALHLVWVSVRSMIKGKKKSVPMIFCMLFSVLILTGCYDGREVEEGAYLLALGIDKGENAAYQYTIQIANPLKLGENQEMLSSKMPEDKKGEEKPEDSKGEKNQGANHITMEADSFYLAMNQIRSYLGKEPELSHLKLLVLSKEFARQGVLDHAALLYQEKEVRPGVMLCLADSAKEYLQQVKPTLEQSTARYYELLFQEETVAYAPVVELQEFVARSVDTGWDAVLPIIQKNGLHGMGIFKAGRLVGEIDGEKAMLYKLFCGTDTRVNLMAGDSIFSVFPRRTGEIKIKKELPSRAVISLPLRAELIQGKREDVTRLKTQLEEELALLIGESIEKEADIFGIGSIYRQSVLSQQDWEALAWPSPLKEMSISVEVEIKLENNVLILQNV